MHSFIQQDILHGQFVGITSMEEEMLGFFFIYVGTVMWRTLDRSMVNVLVIKCIKKRFYNITVVLVVV